MTLGVSPTALRSRAWGPSWMMIAIWHVDLDYHTYPIAIGRMFYMKIVFSVSFVLALASIRRRATRGYQTSLPRSPKNDHSGPMYILGNLDYSSKTKTESFSNSACATCTYTKVLCTLQPVDHREGYSCDRFQSDGRVGHRSFPEGVNADVIPSPGKLG